MKTSSVGVEDEAWGSWASSRKQTQAGCRICRHVWSPIYSKTSWHQFNKLFLYQWAVLKGLYSFYYCHSRWILVYAKGRRIITPPHMCTHENTVTYKRSCFKLPKKKEAQDSVFENFANRAGVTQRLCGCVDIFFYDSWLSGWGRRLFHNTSLEKKLRADIKREKWIWEERRLVTLDSLNHSWTRAPKPTRWPERAKFCIQCVSPPPTTVKMRTCVCVWAHACECTRVCSLRSTHATWSSLSGYFSTL